MNASMLRTSLRFEVTPHGNLFQHFREYLLRETKPRTPVRCKYTQKRQSGRHYMSNTTWQCISLCLYTCVLPMRLGNWEYTVARSVQRFPQCRLLQHSPFAAVQHIHPPTHTHTEINTDNVPSLNTSAHRSGLLQMNQTTSLLFEHVPALCSL